MKNDTVYHNIRCDPFYHYFTYLNTPVIAFPYRLQQFLGGVFDTVTPDPVPGPSLTAGSTDDGSHHSVALVTRRTSGQPFSFPSELSADSSLAHCTTSSVLTQNYANTLECAKTRDDRQNDQHSENLGRTGLTSFADRSDRCRQGTREDLEQRARVGPRRSSCS